MKILTTRHVKGNRWNWDLIKQEVGEIRPPVRISEVRDIPIDEAPQLDGSYVKSFHPPRWNYEKIQKELLPFLSIEDVKYVVKFSDYKIKQSFNELWNGMKLNYPEQHKLVPELRAILGKPLAPLAEPLDSILRSPGTTPLRLLCHKYPELEFEDATPEIQQTLACRLEPRHYENGKPNHHLLTIEVAKTFGIVVDTRRYFIQPFSSIKEKI
jgi:hypothetical protein